MCSVVAQVARYPLSYIQTRKVFRVATAPTRDQHSSTACHSADDKVEDHLPRSPRPQEPQPHSMMSNAEACHVDELLMMTGSLRRDCVLDAKSGTASFFKSWRVLVYQEFWAQPQDAPCCVW